MITEENVKAVIEDTVPGIDASKLGAGDNFFEAGIDSLDHVSILLGLQEKHGLHVPDEDVHLLRSINDILQYASRQ